MSRPSHLPPRCPLQRKPPSRPSYNAIPPISSTRSLPQHHKSFSQSSLWEEQPDWLDGLLEEDPAMDHSKGNSHRRSSSDSIVHFDGLVDTCSAKSGEEISVGSENCSELELTSLYGPNSPRGTNTPSCFENSTGLDSLLSHNARDNALESTLYGPNSPRARANSSFSENAFVSALSESVPQYCLPYMARNFGNSHTVAMGDFCGSAAEPNSETSTTKRHAGPRSRVRKLQYIAELEKRVNFLQALESELSVRTEDLIQQRASLSMENSTLKHRMARLQEEKFVMEDEYHSLMKEVERLKMKLANSPSSNKAGSYFRLNGKTHVDDGWQNMLDMSKLNIR
ncbi:uncharacterized protein At4g06598-like [Rutidosis leptorrhynchoides]|uniref:uncharacterized protein At4g06598-like n=1 Tax=Rutidosis leptorrhynchoides TaxID=125765 RepID=UPI003A9A005E